MQLRRTILLVLATVALVAIRVAWMNYHEAWADRVDLPLLSTTNSQPLNATKSYCHSKDKGADEQALSEQRCNGYRSETKCNSTSAECKWDSILAAHDWCRQMKRLHNVVPYREWGSLGEADIALWHHQHCSSKIAVPCAAARNPSDQLLDKIQLWMGAVKGTPRIMCMVYTTSAQRTKMEAQYRAWGADCDGFVFMSDAEEEALPAIRLEHKGPEEYANMWQKLRATWAFAYLVFAGGQYGREVREGHPDLVMTADEYMGHSEYRQRREALGGGEAFDYFVVGGTDLLLVVENLRQFLLSDAIASQHASGTPLFLGRRFKEPLSDHPFNSGGAGYVLNRHALHVLATALPKCEPDLVGFWEDVMVANCLHAQGISTFDTTDAGGEERFHPFGPSLHMGFKMAAVGTKPNWFEEYTLPFAPLAPFAPLENAGGGKGSEGGKHWLRAGTGAADGGSSALVAADARVMRTGLECCSESSISFHYVEHKKMDDMKSRLACRLSSRGSEARRAAKQGKSSG
jgi:hypothetical protein